ncbi:hypothetical protein CLV36_104263 [Laceyella sediminis]|uniref:Uncharacterized protein n=1 Tax=Laceyella sediminis TaxID=573074 RepID=A0ABX5ET90_9BACL|nr:hypothetical protein CLV36_104263 [Laceyella sediminis]
MFYITYPSIVYCPLSSFPSISRRLQNRFPIRFTRDEALIGKRFFRRRFYHYYSYSSDVYRIRLFILIHTTMSCFDVYSMCRLWRI